MSPTDPPTEGLICSKCGAVNARSWPGYAQPACATCAGSDPAILAARLAWSEAQVDQARVHIRAERARYDAHLACHHGEAPEAERELAAGLELLGALAGPGGEAARRIAESIGDYMLKQAALLQPATPEDVTPLQWEVADGFDIWGRAGSMYVGRAEHAADGAHIVAVVNGHHALVAERDALRARLAAIAAPVEVDVEAIEAAATAAQHARKVHVDVLAETQELTEASAAWIALILPKLGLRLCRALRAERARAVAAEERAERAGFDATSFLAVVEVLGQERLELCAWQDVKRVLTERDAARQEVARSVEKREQLAADLAASLERERIIREKLRTVEAGPEDVWRWMDDPKHDDPASLTCPVVMSAETLRSFVADRAEMARLRAKYEPPPPPERCARCDERFTMVSPAETDWDPPICGTCVGDAARAAGGGT